MTLMGVLLGTLAQLVFALLLFMLAVFAGASVANNRELAPRRLAMLNWAIYVLPGLCVVSAVVVIVSYLLDASAGYYLWYGLPLAGVLFYGIVISDSLNAVVLSRRFWLPAAIMLAAVMATGGYAGVFGFLNKQDVLLFPPVKGLLTLEGEPVADVEIIREATYDDVDSQTVNTDANGRFAFPEWITRSSTPGEPLAEARLRQVIAAKYEGEYYVLWQYTTDRVDEEPVIAQRLANLDCDLADEETDHYFPIPDKPQFDHIVGSICRWSS
ncbi:DUF4198 domain-containing protein [Marinobacter xestospongiae]|uniref:DUF4198 domain-containing protein n=1 Tax=Marinobacter xestospongiae TaxID=994319 RepID=UPI002004DF90|nr:DUF4198 domain-containing protein [Marinobacter xestospongiae]MCK7567045.1 DUF4198 domain-containing protein [Marinobacter xestospongiae]